MKAKNNRFTMQKITSLYINLIPVTENAWHIQSFFLTLKKIHNLDLDNLRSQY